MGEEVASSGEITMDGESLAIALDAAAVCTWDWDFASGELIFSDTLELIFGLEPGTFGQTFDSFNALVHPDDQRRVADAIERARSEGIPYEIEYVICPPGREHRWIAAKGQVIRDARDEPVRMIGVVWEITQRKKVERGLAARARQQSAVAVLGHQAVTSGGEDALFHSAVTLVAQTLDVEMAKVLERLPAGETLLLRAGVGWHPGLVGEATVGTGAASQAGFTLLNSTPVLVDDMSNEKRFRRSPLMEQHGVISGLSVVIRGRERPYGVLGAHTANHRTFNADDANFLTSVANILAAAIQREEGEAARREEYLRVLVEHGTDIVSIIDVDGVRRYMSPVITHVLGYDVEEVVGHTAGNLVHADDAERQRRWIAAVQQDPSRILREEIRVRHKDGSWRHLEMTASNRLDDPLVQGIVLTSRDVTERIEAETALAAERDLLQTLIDSLPDPVYVKDTALRFTRLNQAAARSLGCERVDDVVGKTDFDFFPMELAQRFHDSEQALLATGNPVLDQLEEQSLDAEAQRWLRTSKVALVDDLGRATGLVGGARDVTDQRRIEETLRRERTFLSEVLENAADGIVACDANAKLTLFNRAAREFHGLMEASIPPEQWAEHYSLYQADGQRLLAPEDVPLLRALRGEPVHDVEIMIVPEGGTPRTVLTNGGRLLDDNGNTAGAVAVMHDITEQKALQEQLVQNAFHDPLTGLPNRTFLRDRLKHSLSVNRE